MNEPVASGRTTLSNGAAIIVTGVSDKDAMLAFRVWDVDPAVDVAGHIVWSTETETKHLELAERGTAVNPTVKYVVTRLDRDTRGSR